MGDIIAQGLLDTVFGMGVVFVLLIFIMFIIWSLKFLTVFDKSNKNDTIDKVTNTNSPSSIQNEDEDEIIAVLQAAIQASIDDEQESIIAATAAIMASTESNSADGLVVRTMKNRKNTKWLRG